MHRFAELKAPRGCVAIHWFGQNSFAIKDWHGTVLMIDPYFPRNRPAGEFIHPRPPLDERDIEPNAVLLTHDHGDHTCAESLTRIRAAFPQTRYYGPLESIERLLSLGVSKDFANRMTPGDVSQVGSARIHALFSKPAQGAEEEGIPIPDVEHLGYVVDMGQVRIYISGDLIRTFSRHEELLRPIIDLQPQIGLLTTHPTEIEFPDFQGSVEIATKLGLEIAIPAHYGCFAKRTFDPNLWASCFPPHGPKPVIIGYDSSFVYCRRGAR